jgi:hypothetical protein
MAAARVVAAGRRRRRRRWLLLLLVVAVRCGDIDGGHVADTRGRGVGQICRDPDIIVITEAVVDRQCSLKVGADSVRCTQGLEG